MELPEAIAELNVFRVLLRRPKLAKRVNDLLMVQLFGAELDTRLRELIMPRLSPVVDSGMVHWPSVANPKRGIS